MRNAKRGIKRDGEMGHIIFDAHGEARPMLFGIQEVIDALHAIRLSIFARETITATEDAIELAAFLDHRSDDVEVKRLALGARLLGAIENSDLLDRGRNGFGKKRARERTIKVNFD